MNTCNIAGVFDVLKEERTLVMRFQILHEIKGRMRIHVVQKYMTDEQAEALQYFLNQHDAIISAKVYERTQDVVICYEGDRTNIVNEKGEEIFKEYDNVEPLRLKNILSDLMYEKSILKYSKDGKYGKL